MNLKALVTSLTLSVCIAGLSGCGNFTLFPGVHKIAVMQGNIVDQEMVDQLKPGMSKTQVRFVLGTPLIADTFDHQRWDYYYSIKYADGSIKTEKFSVFFEGDLLESFEGDIAPSELAASDSKGDSDS